MRFSFRNHKPLHFEIVKYQINVVICGIGNDMLLSLYKRKFTSEFKDEFFEIVDKGLL